MATKALVRKVSKFVTVPGGKGKTAKKLTKVDSAKTDSARRVLNTNKMPLRVVTKSTAARPSATTVALVTERAATGLKAVLTSGTADRVQARGSDRNQIMNGRNSGFRNAGGGSSMPNTGRPVIVDTGKVVKLFKQGDKVVYPGHGVGEINSVMSRTIAATEQSFYDITIVESGMKIMVPVHQAQAVGLRKVIDRKAIDEVYTILRNRNFKIDTQTWNRRFREYSLKIKTGSVFEIAEVLRDLSVLGADKELSFGEKKMLDVAQSLLVSELAIAKSRPHDKIIGELKEIFA